MKLSKQDQKYQARQQLSAKFRPQNNTAAYYVFNCLPEVDVTRLLKKVVK